MGSKWTKLKLALGLDSCVHIPRSFDNSSSAATRFSGGVSPTVVSPAGDSSSYRPSTPTPSSSGLRLPKSGPKSPKMNNNFSFNHTLIFLIGAWWWIAWLITNGFPFYTVLLVSSIYSILLGTIQFSGHISFDLSLSFPFLLYPHMRPHNR
uniref:Uncharacterized protein n=1 Tax=Glycine max TaxID=3847 RepID=K7LQF2_SOYBN